MRCKAHSSDPQGGKRFSDAAARVTISRMSIHFNGRALAVVILLSAALVVLATADRGGIARFLSDALAVVWVYFALKIFVRAHALTLAGLVFGMGVFIEMGQYLTGLWGWRLPNPVLRAVVGSAASWADVLAYAVGWLMVVMVELLARWLLRTPFLNSGRRRS